MLARSYARSASGRPFPAAREMRDGPCTSATDAATGTFTIVSPMTPLARRRPFAARLASLRSRADAGDASAWWELGCLLLDGDVDSRGRVRVSPDHRGAFRAFLQGAQGGDDNALLTLGVCYDNGTGTRRDRVAAWRCYQRVWRRTHHAAAAVNLATWHRDHGELRLAVAWFGKAADAGDSDAYVDLAYGFYYGLGTTQSTASALRALARAERATSITPYGSEEGRYLRAVILLDRGRRGDTTAAMSWLQRAAADNDYPEADAVPAALQRGVVPTPCRCRRHQRRSVPGQAPCALHSAQRRSPLRRR